MARKEFEQVVAQAPKKRMAQFKFIGQTIITSTFREKVYVYAPANTIGKATAIFVKLPPVASATSGNNILGIGYDLTDDAFILASNMTKCEYWSTQAQTMEINKGMCLINNDPSVAIFREYPKIAQLPTVLQDIYFDDTTPLYIEYYNSTNGDQIATAYRIYYVEYLIEEVRA